MPPSVVWGLTTGLFIAVIDAAAIAIPGSFGISQDVAENVDLLLNVVLYAALGFRVGRWTGFVREAAEAGVIAGLVAATIGVALSYLVRAEPQSESAMRDIIGTYALNVSIGGVVAWLSGWYGTIARESGPAKRP